MNGLCRAPSLTTRLAALFALSSAALLLIFGAAIYYVSDRHFIEQDAHDLHARVEVIVNVLAQNPTPRDASSGAAALPAPSATSTTSTLPALLDSVLVSHHELAVRLIDQHGAPLYARAPEVFADAPPADLNIGGNNPTHDAHSGGLSTFRHNGQLWRAVFLSTPDAEPVQRIWLAIGIEHHADFLANLLRWLLIGGAAATLLSGGLGIWVARRGLRPLQKISANATLISAQRLSERLDEAPMPQELLPLVRELNAMLARLEEAFRRLTEFSSDIAHELRTPVSNLVMQTEVALTRARSADEYREVLASNLEEFGRLGRMISDMLFLARADHGLVVPERRPVDLAREVDALISFYEALAEERQLQLQRDGNAHVQGDALMLRRAVSNLLANAIRHANPGSLVSIRLCMNGVSAQIDVCNHGPNISPEHLPRLFDRFYRADFARPRAAKSEGEPERTGLGLGIVKSIVEAHGGGVAVFSIDGETCFRITLP